MKKINSLLLFLLVYPILLFTQEISISEEITLRNDLSYEIIGSIKGQLLLFKNQGTKFEVMGYNDKMRQVWDKEIELEKRQPKVVGMMTNQNSFTLIYNHRLKGNTILKAHKYDAGANLKDTVTIKDFGYLFYTPNFQIIRSEDRSKLLIYYLDKQTTFKAYVYDVINMKLLWETAIEPEKFLYTRDFAQILVDNTGNVHLILKKDNIRSQKNVHFYELHQFFGANNSYSISKIPLEGKLTFDVFFTYDNLNDKLIGTGFYSEKNMARATGFFFLSVPAQKQSGQVLKFHPFKDEFVANLLGLEQGKKKNKGLVEIAVQEIVLRRDGGAIMVNERNRQLERRGGVTNRAYVDNLSRFIVDYYYDELFLFSFHPDGSLHWKTILHKKQYSQDDDGMYSSYFLLKTPSNLRFLFNDEIRHENTVSEYIINGRGNYDRNSLLSTEYKELRLRFRDALQTNSTTAIVPSERRNKLRLVKFKY